MCLCVCVCYASVTSSDSLCPCVHPQSDQMNRVLYVLTLATTVIIPTQLLSGLYGMNFEEMPELHWKYSYAAFWAVLLLLTYLVYVIIRRMNLFIH